jgi:predicted permease
MSQDFRYAVRTLINNPVFMIAAVVCLALGIGANTAIFSVVHAVLLEPLPYGDPDHLVILQEDHTEGPNIYFSPADYLDIRSMSESFEDVTGHRWYNATLTGYGDPERIRAETVSPSFFHVFGIEPVLGRWFLREGDPDARAVRSIVLNYASWQNRFGGDPAIIGRALILNGEPHTIVGIAPPSFRFPENPEMWVRAYRDDVPEPPINLGEALGEERVIGFFKVVARLAPGVSREQAHAELDIIAQRLDELAGADSEPIGLTTRSLHEFLVGDVRPTMMLLLAAVGLVLLIACGNVANLLLARATAREREVAVRATLGASRWRIIRQLLTENLLLGVAGGFVGLLLALWGVDALVKLAPGDLPRLAEVGIDRWALAYAAGISLATGIIFGMVPALRASQPDLQQSLKEGGRGHSGAGRRWSFRDALVVSEIGLSLMLLCGAGLLIKSLLVAQTETAGFEPDDILTMYVVLSDTQYVEAHQQARFFQQVTERVDALSGVDAVGAIYALPFTGSAAYNGFGVEGRPTTPPKSHTLLYHAVTPGYFHAMGIPLIRGRVLSERDSTEAPPVIVVNETLARQHWPDEDPVGKRISLGDEDFYREVVGVVGDVRHFGYERIPEPEGYLSYHQKTVPRMALVVRARGGDPLRLVGAVTEQVYAVDGNQPVFAVRTMEEVLYRSTRQRRFTVQLLGLFAAVAILLALVGIYGVMSYTVNRRIHEIGIRMALGARRAEVMQLTLAWGLKLVLVGTVLGVLGTLAGARVIASLLYGISATDPAVLGGVILLLVAVASAAAFIPAHRAARVDPVVALRHE